MERQRRYTGRVSTAFAGLAALAVLVAACTDKSNPAAPGGGGSGGGTGPGGKPVTVQALECRANVRAKTVECAAPSTGGGPNAIIVPGPNNVYVKLTSSNANYDGGLGRFTFNVTVRNLVPQALGTTDGTTLDPTGVRVFFEEGPIVTSGTGSITVVGDGTGTFTSGVQPYYQYNEVLSEFELSPVKQWRLDMPSTVNTFSFKLMVSAPVQYPNGWIEVDPSTVTMPALQVKNLGLRVRSALGEVDSVTAPSVNVSDPAIAAVGTPTYVSGSKTWTVPVIGIQSGTVAVNATAGSAPSLPMNLNVGGIQRIWKGTVDNNYNDPANWQAVIGIPIPPFAPSNLLRGVPSSVDTAVVHTDSATVFPVMAQNNTVGGVIMVSPLGDPTPPSINLSSFDYTLTSSIDQDDAGQILGTGRMIFSGTAKTISGGLTNVDYRNARFTGTYSLDSNLNVTGGRIVVQGGRLRSAGFRIRVRPN